MKPQLEQISPPKGRSFRIMINPNLSDLFYWHFHPEIELVYIYGVDGKRHVGKHLSGFKNSDLVLIGSYMPHLNFDYGIKKPYQKRVIHFRPDFMELAPGQLPEFKTIAKLFENAKFGLAFGEKTKQMVHNMIVDLHQQNGFKQFTNLLKILNKLASATDIQYLHTSPYINPYRKKDQDRLSKVYAFIENEFHRKIEISEVAALSYFTEASFCRYFKKMTKLTFVAFLNQFRIEKAKKMLMQKKSISETACSCGFESVSYFNRTFKHITGQNPSNFKAQF
ncbi:MAG: AraC family transcriptional regulator [Bacteroidetes bacterium]|nr:AraC family transcriptional regulator [Bacteroidota bacterium]